uniref:Uncharacterized protein n=1 Tax=Hyaloperonospora arabidopsidis (strain Emoy2) TaxID=559515 RepID=M4BZQ4_HYAAE
MLIGSHRGLQCSQVEVRECFSKRQRMRLVRRIDSSRSARHLSVASGFFTDSWASESLMSSFVGCLCE